jgi:integrase/recombinase XerD
MNAIAAEAFPATLFVTIEVFMHAARSEKRPLLRLVIELLGRTGMRVGELCGLEADSMVKIGETHWLRIPVGKLHNDR